VTLSTLAQILASKPDKVRSIFNSDKKKNKKISNFALAKVILVTYVVEDFIGLRLFLGLLSDRWPQINQ